MSVEDIIEKARLTYLERGKQYGNTWDITHALYPNGVVLDTPQASARFHILQWMIGKLVRYANSGAIDCIHDAGVYAFILEHIDSEASNHLSKPQTSLGKEIISK